MSPAEAPAPRERPIGGWHPYAILLVAAMAVGSGFMWVGLPIVLVYAASQIASSSEPSMGPYLVIVFGLPLGMVAIGKGLAALDRHYGRVTGTLYTGPLRTASSPSWLRSLRGERTSTRPRTILDSVMVISVIVCVIAAAVWFFAFAGDPTPPGG